MLFEIRFLHPEFISSSGVDHDYLRIFFVETESYIQCSPMASVNAGRMRLLQDTVDTSYPLYVPEMTVLYVELPPQ